MPGCNFGLLLLDWLKEEGISRKTLIALLQSRFYRDFGGLDSITLSRWINGKSTPALYKQMLIVKVLEKDPISFLMNIDSQERYPKKTSTIVDMLIKSLDLSLNVLSYDKVTENTASEIVIHSSVEHFSKFENFYSNVSALEHFRTELSNFDKYKHHAILLKNKAGSIVGHWSSIIDMDFREFTTLPKMSKDNVDKACLVQLGYFANSEHFFELVVQASCFYLETLWEAKEVVYIFVAGKPVVDFCVLVFGAEIVQYYRPMKQGDKLSVYLIKFDIVRAISNPVILPKIKRKLGCIQRCINCGSCNLRDFY